MKKKIKIFLGAYINQSNAQNLNCQAIARHINKNKFEVYTLSIKHGNFGTLQIDDVNIFTCYFPIKLTRYIGFLWGIYKCDVAYLERPDIYRFQRLLVSLFKKKSFKTVETIIDLEKPEFIYRPVKEIVENFKFVDKSFAISEFIRDYHKVHLKIVTEDFILYQVPLLLNENLRVKPIEGLKEIVFIGNDMKRKGIDDYIELSKHFPQIVFNVIGRDEQGIFNERSDKFRNILFHGMLDKNDLLKVLNKSQLHILPSRLEGFPRMIIECALAGIPTITYSDYGAKEWIVNYENGIVCDYLDEMRQGINSFLLDPDLLKRNSNGAFKLGKKYTPERIVNLYEKVIEKILT
ncbi:MAG: glycosyltransferase family 4 protein [Bacteroidota bacterium]